MFERTYWVYILASGRNGTLYTGVTNDLARRAWEHREGAAESFTRRHKVDQLVWYEAFEQMTDAIAHEKRIKGWRRAWKLELIERDNPEWRDLYLLLAG